MIWVSYSWKYLTYSISIIKSSLSCKTSWTISIAIFTTVSLKQLLFKCVYGPFIYDVCAREMYMETGTLYKKKFICVKNCRQGGFLKTRKNADVIMNAHFTCSKNVFNIFLLIRCRKVTSFRLQIQNLSSIK